jgi:hypothetical protein
MRPAKTWIRIQWATGERACLMLRAVSCLRHRPWQGEYPANRHRSNHNPSPDESRSSTRKRSRGHPAVARPLPQRLRKPVPEQGAGPSYVSAVPCQHANPNDPGGANCSIRQSARRAGTRCSHHIASGTRESQYCSLSLSLSFSLSRSLSISPKKTIDSHIEVTYR